MVVECTRKEFFNLLRFYNLPNVTVNKYARFMYSLNFKLDNLVWCYININSGSANVSLSGHFIIHFVFTDYKHYNAEHADILLYLTDAFK
jgi:hypothetical protein